MFIKQVSVFLENREGSMKDVAKVLNENKISIISFSLADTSEYGMLRLIVSEPEVARDILKEAGFSSMLTDVLAVRMENGFMNLTGLLDILSEADINIEYMYAISNLKDTPALILKLSNSVKAMKALNGTNYQTYEFEDIK